MPQPEQNVIVLVADDEPSTLALVASHVRAKGYKVLEASDGDQAWQLAHEHLPDLVILDVMMPGMSGWEVCRKIREAVSLAHTGVIMLTGIGENLNEMTSPLYGADTYLDKPFEFASLDEKVTQTLAERKQGAMGRPDPEVAALRESSLPPPPKGNGVVLEKGPKAKPPATTKRTAKKADPRPKEAARPLVKAAARKDLEARTTKQTKAAKRTAPERIVAKATIKAAPKKASKPTPRGSVAKRGAKKVVATRAKKAGAQLAAAKSAAKKRVVKKAPKPAAKKAKAASGVKKSAAKPAAKRASAKKAAATKGASKRAASKAVAKASAKKPASKKAAPKKRAATAPQVARRDSKKAAPAAVATSQGTSFGKPTLSPPMKKRRSPTETPSGGVTV
jgi:DNA-binding response OmpR family regulator